MRRLAIIGCGLIGGSIELAARERLSGVEVTALDRGDPLEAAAEADLVVLAAPIRDIIDLLGALRQILPPGALITDTGSTKVAIVGAAAGLRFVGGHPIAGAAASGRRAARADLFAGRPWVLTPGPDADPGDVQRLRIFVEALGATPHVLDPREHDRLLAFVSHLPQLVASALMAVAGSGVGAEGLALAGAGLRDTTRLAGSRPGIWRDIAATNADNIARALDALIDALTRLRDDPNAETLTSTFESAARWKAIVGNTQRDEYADSDAPGQPDPPA